jgi:cyclopropane fatty-acyl-phospholipid synthase-like methyltransferase
VTIDARKAIVRDGYDAVSQTWAEHRHTVEDCELRKWAGRFCAALPAGARVLDLGCGSGEPMLAELVARGYLATGVDLSPSQVAEARRRCPGATVLEGDLAEVVLAAGSFDGVVAYDSIWHVPCEQHALVFKRIREWLVPGGVALLTLGAAPEDTPEKYNPMMGAPMYHSAWPRAVNLRLLEEAGFTIVREHVEPMDPAQPDCGHQRIELRARQL